MPAPVPIRISYDDAGALGIAAAAAGSGQAYQQQVDRDAQFLNQEMGRRQQSLQFAQRNQLEHAKMVQQSRLRGSGTVGQGQQRYDKGMAQSMRRQRLTQQAGMNPEDQNMLNLASEYGDRGTVNQLIRRAGGQVGSPMLEAKQAYLDSFVKATNLPAHERSALDTLASSEDVDIAQFRIAASGAAKRAEQQSTTLPPQYLAKQAYQEVGREIYTLEQKAKQFEKQLRDEGHNVLDPPTQFNPTIREFQGGTLRDLFTGDTPTVLGGNIKEFYYGDGDVVKGGNPTMMRVYTEYQRIQQQIKQLRARQKGIVEEDEQETQEKRAIIRGANPLHRSAPQSPTTPNTDPDDLNEFFTTE